MRRPTCRGGRLCPPKTRAPCRAEPACPPGKNVSFAAGHIGPALQVISQGAMPTSPRRHWRGTAALQGSLWEGAVGAADWGREKPYDSSPSVSASRCHLPRRGRQGENGLPRRFAPRNDSASRCMVRRPAKKGSTRAGASFTYTQCFSRLSHRLLSHVPRLWNSCTSRIRMTTATSITRYLYR